MGNQFIKIITGIALFSVFILQGIWLYNTYNLLEKELVGRLDKILSRSIEKEVYTRFDSPGRHKSNGKIIKGSQPKNDPDTNALAFQEFLVTEGTPLNFIQLDSIFKSDLNKDVGQISYSLRMIDSNGNV